MLIFIYLFVYTIMLKIIAYDILPSIINFVSFRKKKYNINRFGNIC